MSDSHRRKERPSRQLRKRKQQRSRDAMHRASRSGCEQRARNTQSSSMVRSMLIGAGLIGAGVVLFFLLRPTPPRQKRTTEHTAGAPRSSTPRHRRQGSPSPSKPVADMNNDTPSAPLDLPQLPTMPVSQPKPAPTRLVDHMGALSTSILWRAGRLNGKPASPESAWRRDEFSIFQSESGSVHAAHGAGVPQILRSGQTLVLTPSLRCDCILNIRFSQSLRSVGNRHWQGTQTGRFCEVRLNDRLIYAKWLLQDRHWVRVWLPKSLLRAQDNVIAIENCTDGSWAWDALWIESAAGGPSADLAVAGGAWLPNSALGSIKTIVLQVSCNGVPAMTPESFQQRSAKLPREATSSFAAPAGKETEWLRTDDSRNGLIENLRRTLSQGRRPIVQLQSVGEFAWLRVVLELGGVVSDWIVPGHVLKAHHDLITSIQDGCPRMRFYAVGDEPSTGQILRAEHSMADTMGAHWQSALRRSDAITPTWLRIDAYGCPAPLTVQRATARLACRQIIEFWNAGGSRVIVGDAVRGKSLFPAGNSRSAPAWSLFRDLAAVAARRSAIVNVVPYDAGHGLLDTTWVAGQKSGSVIAAYTASADRTRTVSFQVPCPWPSAYVQVEGVDLTVLPFRRKVTTKKLQAQNGMVTVPVELTGFGVIRTSKSPILEKKGIARNQRPVRLSKKLELTFPQNPPTCEACSSVLATHRPVYAIGTNTSVDEVAATPMAINEQSKKSVPPIHKRSQQITLKSPSSDDSLTGAVVGLNWGGAQNAKILDLWICANSSIGAANVSISIGTRHGLETVRLRTGTWCRLRLPLNCLPGRGVTRLPQFLFVQAGDTTSREYRDGGTVTLEINDARTDVPPTLAAQEH